MSKLYLDNGYPNIDWIVSRNLPFNVLLGPRTCGKTYGVFDWAYRTEQRFFWLRRGAAEAEATSSEVSAPWKRWFADHGKTFRHYKNGLLTEVWETAPDANDPDKMVDLKLLGYVGALCNFANVQGYDAYDVKTIILDEFIPQESSHIKIRGETKAFLNMCTAVARNRELEGKPPVKVWLMGNTNSIVGSELYLTLGVDKAYRSMAKSGEEFIERADIGVGYYSFSKSPIAQEMAKTSIMRLGEKICPEFYDMAVKNKFAQEDDLMIRPNLRGLDVVCVVGDLAVYCMDVNQFAAGSWHVCRTQLTEEQCRKRDIPWFADTKQGLANAYYAVGYLLDKKYKRGMVTYESSEVLIEMLDMLRQRGMYK